MSFGSDMGKFLTSTDECRVDLIIEDAEVVPIDFDSFLLTYKKDDDFFIRLGLLGNPGPKNELTLKGRELRPGMTYPISPEYKGVTARFALENYTQSLPSNYSGMLNVESVVTAEDGSTTVVASFSIYYQDPAGKEMEVRCQTLQLST